MTAKVYLSEYRLTMVSGVIAPRAPAVVVQAPIVTSASPQSFQPFQGEMVRLSVDSGGPVNVRWGTAPSASAVDERWAPNQSDWRIVNAGDTVSVVACAA
jgi:hypothetical protein